MREFFRGWRRKAGCVLLLMALIVWSCWLRSLIVSDLVMLNQGTTIVRSAPNDLALLLSPAADGAEWSSPRWISITNGPLDPQPKDWTWQFCGFRYGHQLKGKATTTTTHPDGRVVTEEIEYIAHEHVWVIPYWSIANPLTVFSAYLILWKPRRRV
jgi:hypothetical protein